MRATLTDQRRIRRRSDRPFAQLAMERRHHFRLPMGCRSYVVACGKQANRFSTGTLVIETDEVAGVEIDHEASWFRSSLMVKVESVPPRRYLRCPRKACVNLGCAKNGFAGSGDAGTILAMSRPRSVTYTSPARARRTEKVKT